MNLKTEFDVPVKTIVHSNIMVGYKFTISEQISVTPNALVKYKLDDIDNNIKEHDYYANINFGFFNTFWIGPTFYYKMWEKALGLNAGIEYSYFQLAFFAGDNVFSEGNNEFLDEFSVRLNVLFDAFWKDE